MKMSRKCRAQINKSRFYYQKNIDFIIATELKESQMTKGSRQAHHLACSYLIYLIQKS